MVCSPEEIAYRMGYIGAESLFARAQTMKSNDYGRSLLRLLESERVLA